MALRNPEVVVDAITVVAGNVPLAQAVQNALYVVDLCGADVPVYAGAPSPLVQPLGTAQDVHGDDGMGDIGLPVFGRTPEDGDAVDMMIETILSAPGEITLVAIGPLTNIALALKRAPELSGMVAHCYIMGGTGVGDGNVTPLAEYNFWADPEAAAIVVASNMAKTIIGWDIPVASGSFSEDEATQLRSLGTTYAKIAVDIQGVLNTYAQSTSDLEGFDLADPMAMAVAIKPDIATVARAYVEVLTGSGPARGALSTDWRRLTPHQPNASVVTAVPRAAFMDLLHIGLT